MQVDKAGRSAQAWHDRLAGRVAFEWSAAEAAIRRVYQASNLPEPSQVLCVRGPKDAAQAAAFLERPPRKWRRMILAVFVVGTVACLSLAPGITWSRPLTSLEAAFWAGLLATLGLILGGWHHLPVWPGQHAAGGRKGPVILLGGAIFLALAGHSFALQRLGGFPADPIKFAVVLALSIIVGALPAALLAFRVRRAYGHLPPSLRSLAPQRSISRQLERARGRAWMPLQPAMAASRPHNSLSEAYRAAHREAFTGRADLAAFWRWAMADAALQMPQEGLDAVPPPHLDGITDSARAASLDCTGAKGAAADFADLAFHVDRLYPFETVAVAVRPAATLALDAEGRPHAEEGPALAWADGTRVFAWHGRLVSPEIVDPDRPVTHWRISREIDPERRWVLIERYGLGRYLLEAGASEIQRDVCGRLYRLAQSFGDPLMAVRVVNSTPEQNGRFREFWLCVPPTMTTARQAVAWTFGLTAEEYDPVNQS